MQINSINNGYTPSFGMGFSITKGAQELCHGLMDSGVLDRDAVSARLAKFAKRYGEDAVDLTLGTSPKHPGKIVAIMSDPSGANFSKSFGPRRFFEGARDLSKNMLNKLSKIKDADATKKSGPVMEKYSQKQAEAVQAAKKAVSEAFFDQFVK